jgi:hypothetical protein
MFPALLISAVSGWWPVTWAKRCGGFYHRYIHASVLWSLTDKYCVVSGIVTGTMVGGSWPALGHAAQMRVFELVQFNRRF